MLHPTKMTCLGLSAFLVMTLGLIGTSDAASRRSAALDPTCAAPEPACCAPAPKCCYNPCIKYLSRGLHRRCYSCETQKIVLNVQDPCKCGCAVAVPVCIPACVKGEPCVDSRCALFGRGVVTYTWCCGFQVRVVIDRCGDITVTNFYR